MIAHLIDAVNLLHSFAIVVTAVKRFEYVFNILSNWQWSALAVLSGELLPWPFIAHIYVNSTRLCISF